MTPFSQLLDLELERCGYKARERHFNDMVSALRARDFAAFDAAKMRFDNSTREPGGANNAPGTV